MPIVSIPAINYECSYFFWKRQLLFSKTCSVEKNTTSLKEPLLIKENYINVETPHVLQSSGSSK